MEGTPRTEQAPARKEILNDWDRNVLEKGLTSVIEQMYKDFDGKLPDVIVLPDTSARPLYYAIDSGTSKLIAEKEIKKPLYYFFKSNTPNSMQQSAEFWLDKPIETSAEMKEHWIGQYPDDEYFTEQRIDQMVKNANPERMKRIREVMKERAQEIMADAEKRLGRIPAVAVVDEVVAGERTINEIENAFSETPLHSYAVTGEGSDKVYIGRHNHIESTAEGRKGGNPDREYTNKFSYSGTPSVGVHKGLNKLGTPTEVENKYASRDHIRLRTFTEQKAQLRAEMRAIGEKIAAKVVEDLEEKDKPASA